MSEALIDRIVKAQKNHEERFTELLQGFSQEISLMIALEVERQLPRAIQKALEIGVDPRTYK